MKRTVSLCITALLSCLLTCPALAADTLLLTPTLYPTEVNEYASGEEMRLERTYCLSPTDDPASIPVGDFDREGWHYTLLDVTRQENSKSDEKDYAETYTLNMDTKDMEKIMPQLAAERTVTTEDGYTGTLVLDTSSIKVEAAGYNTSTKTVTATRTYADIGCTYQGGGTDCKGDVRAIRKRRAEARRFSVLIFRDGYAVAQLKSGNGASLCIGTVQIVFDLPLGQPQHLPFLYPLHHRAEPAGQRQQREKCQDTVEHKWMCRRPLGVKAAYAQPDQNRQKLQAQEQSEHQPDCKDKQNKCGESKKYLLQDRHSKNLLYLVLLLSHASKIVSKNRKINQFRRNAAQFETHFDSRKEQPNIRHEAVSNHLCRSSMAI